jgi:undecaprenyl-diphosphatase
MEILTGLLLGVIQGVFEWLPVSSEAVISLFLTQVMNQPPVESINTAVYLHTGTMLAALYYFREEYIDIFQEVPAYLNSIRQQQGVREYSLINFLLVSTLLTGIIGGGIYFTMLSALENLQNAETIFASLTGAALLITGAMKLEGNSDERVTEDADLKDAVFTGMLQGLAIVPGISRSGSTVFALFFREFDSKSAFKLSFLMSVPAVLAAQIGLGLLSGFMFDSGLAAAVITSFIVGILSIDAVLKIADRAEVAYLCFLLAGLSFLSALL